MTNLPVIKGKITARQPDGSVIGIEFRGEVTWMQGNIHAIARVVLEVEEHGNSGRARIHLFLE